MTKQDIQARIAQILLEMDNAIKQHTALSSHLNECNFWLAKWEELESKQADYAVGVVDDEVDAEEAE